MRRILTVCAAVLAAGTAVAAPALAVSGGEPAQAGAAPWMATITFKGDQPLVQRESCGGALIAPDRVATAAHCLDHGDPTHLEVHLGGGTLSQEPGRVVPIAGWSVDPAFRLIPSPLDPQSFEKSSAAEDAAVIKLAHPVFGVPTLPVARTAPKPGSTVDVYGHGLTKAPDPKDPTAALGDQLKHARLSVIDDRTCAAGLADPAMLDGPSVLCTQGTATVCPGDSGGPLVEKTPLGDRLAGIVSFAGETAGKQCGEPTVDGFGDAAAMRSFLTQPRPPLAPMADTEPAITGTKAAGATLTCEAPKWSTPPAKADYAWYYNKVDPSNGFEFYVPVEGATSPTLTVTPDLSGHKLNCGITASTAGGTVLLYSDVV
ncbi:trypsin-like serine protease [Amycolatopsis sp. FDAARGOS 1241]|uniref:S1 family peptidase n=1 Tax=Amycolatopsis sp. FDAARGOS 1241 TaxID=2778070 RepID=UPI00194FB032|nr:serine protease [Amycolatopsis sp. FDAARGOS 1241]QRP46449.1 serine protease [Amycolatopsis sp. FDAARGOS 1241]